MTLPSPPEASRVLAVLSTAFVQVLRGQGVATSPAEAIEVRRVLAMFGAADLTTLRPALRAVTVKYDRERPGFERSFDVFFGLIPAALGTDGTGGGAGRRGPDAQRLPTDLELTDDDRSASDYDPTTPDVGDLLDAEEDERGFTPHRDDDDVSMGGADSDLSVSSDDDRGRRGASYTVDLERAGSAVARELTGAQNAAAHGSIDLDDPEAILAWLAAHDPHSVYADGPEAELDELTATQLGRLVEAIAAFVSALAAEIEGRDPRTGPDAVDRAEPDPPDMARACHELLHRMRGAPRRVPREHARGPLDVRHTVRRSMRSDGVPFHLLVRKQVPDRVRLLVVADVSLSVRSVTAFVLRLAQTLHAMAFRCHVLAYVDTPVDVTDLLMRASGEQALATVLAAPGLDLDATSDYGRVLSGLNGEFAGLVDRRTAVLFVGDGRCNGLPSGDDELRRLHRRAHRVGWITPEPRRYWNQASCAMPVYSTIVDHVVTARDARELLAQAGELGHALS